MRTCTGMVAGVAVGWLWMATASAGYAQDQPPSELHAFPPAGDPAPAPRLQPMPPPMNNPTPPPFTPGPAPVTSPTPAAAMPDIAQPYVVTEGLGSWMICVGSYTGEDAPQNAVRLVEELRSTYRLAAYIFNRGADERRKERERVAELIRKQREYCQYLAQLNMPPSPTAKIRVRHIRIEEQCAVLIGGYKDMDAARRDLERIKRLRPLDPQRIKVEQELAIVTKEGRGEKVVVNPSLAQGFLVVNPACPQTQRAPNSGDMDIALLRKLNADEPYSLLKCPRKYTLAIAQLQTPTVVQSETTSSSFLESLGFGSRGAAHEDAAALNARNFAKLLRKNLNQEAYVLHTRYSSVVTVGSYDSDQDPRMRNDAERLNNIMRLQQVIRLLPQPTPMLVPR